MTMSNEQAIEVANLPSTAVTRLGCYLLSVGLASLATDKATSISNAFLAQTKNIQDFVSLNDYGISAALISDSLKIAKGNLEKIRAALLKNVIDDFHVTSDEVKFVKFAMQFAIDPEKNERYLSRARKFATTVSAAYLRNFDKVVEKIESSGGTSKVISQDVDGLYDQLDQVIEDILGRKPKRGETSIPTATLNEMSKTNSGAELVKEYRRIKRDISAAYDVAFSAFMSRQSGNIPVHEVYKHMDDLGFDDSKVLKTNKKLPLLVGMANGKIKYYTEDGLPLATGIPSNAVDITFPRTYKDDGTGAYVSYTTPGALGITRVYTESHAKQSVEKKFDAAAKVDTSIDKVMSRWTRDLSSTDPISMMGATAAIMIYLTGMRVGSRQNSAASATGEKTFGAISLRPRHIRLNKSSITLTYPGKKNVPQKHLIKVDDVVTRRLYKNLETLLEDKSGDDLVFSVDNRGKEVVLSYGYLNKYLKASGYPAGVHKIRHVRGTNKIIEMLNSTKFVPTAKAKDNLTKRQKEAETFIVNKVIMPATEMLGHKSGDGKSLWRTTVKSYLNPAPLVKFFQDNGLRKPSWLPAKEDSE